MADAGAAPLVDPKRLDHLHEEFAKLTTKSHNDQMEFFLKSFIFALGDSWSEVPKLLNRYQAYLEEKSEKFDLDAAQAADFLQHMGKTRTALERRTELADIDLDSNDRICFIEYLLLHFKTLILTEFFKRLNIEPTVSLENDGIGLVGVGDFLMDELYTIPYGMTPELEAAIEEFMAKKKQRESTINRLKTAMQQSGVKGLTAKNELMQLESQDLTDMNRMEITLNAAKKRCKTESGAVALENKRQLELKQQEEQRAQSRNKLAARAAMFDQK